ncbi:hypothetical protein [Roseiconus lacunae]|uniref:hypothetical protein n=1 Tax=Roseiconus lacunae TaxID=2605694 RepID=UPI001356CC90|nr:hypothetical protein [Roseiconus lacunae]
MDLFPDTSLLTFSIEPTASDHDSFQCDVFFATPHGFGDANTNVNSLWVSNSVFDAFVSDVGKLCASKQVYAELSDLSEWFSLRLCMFKEKYAIHVAFQNQNDMYADTKLSSQATLTHQNINALRITLIGFPRPWRDQRG